MNLLNCAKFIYINAIVCFWPGGPGASCTAVGCRDCRALAVEASLRDYGCLRGIYASFEYSRERISGDTH